MNANNDSRLMHASGRPVVVSILLAMLLVVAAAGRSNAQGMLPAVTDTVVMTTSAGTITLVLYGVDAPKTVENFIKLAQKGFFNGMRFHRVVPGRAIQSGDPNTKDTLRRSEWGRGGESIFGHDFEDELNPNSPSYKRGYLEGTLVMANRRLPNTNTSQFFIAVKDFQMEKTSTIFGRVVAGIDVVHAIENAPIADPRTGMPVKPVVIQSVRVAHAGK